MSESIALVQTEQYNMEEEKQEVGAVRRREGEGRRDERGVEGRSNGRCQCPFPPY